jgi:apolipoprotein N-acyltransferase
MRRFLFCLLASFSGVYGTSASVAAFISLLFRFSLKTTVTFAGLSLCFIVLLALAVYALMRPIATWQIDTEEYEATKIDEMLTLRMQTVSLHDQQTSDLMAVPRML